jgi:hypothetical protein
MAHSPATALAACAMTSNGALTLHIGSRTPGAWPTRPSSGIQASRLFQVHPGLRLHLGIACASDVIDPRAMSASEVENDRQRKLVPTCSTTTARPLRRTRTREMVGRARPDAGRMRNRRRRDRADRVAALAVGRSEEQRRDVYATREDCLADWGNKPGLHARHRGAPSHVVRFLRHSYGYTSGSSDAQSGALIGSSAFLEVGIVVCEMGGFVVLAPGGRRAAPHVEAGRQEKVEALASYHTIVLAIRTRRRLPLQRRRSGQLRRPPYELHERAEAVAPPGTRETSRFQIPSVPRVRCVEGPRAPPMDAWIREQREPKPSNTTDTPTALLEASVIQWY